ncbi:MAG: hypothetical protein ACOY3P_17265 [Planctomycetota bacterium]
MATVTSKRRLRFRESMEPDPSGSAAPRRRGRYRLWVGLGLGVPLILLALLPTLIAHTPVSTWILASAAGDLEGELRARSFSLGWFAPVAARDLELHDAKGGLVLQADEVATEKSLWRLLLSPSSPGKCRIERPKLHLVMRPDGSNLEDVIEKILAAPPPESRPALELEVVDGTLQVTDATNGATWHMESLQLKLNLPADAAAPIELTTEATVADPAHPGKLNAKLNMPSTGPAAIDVELGRFPAAIAQPILARYIEKPRLAGHLTGKVAAKLGGAEGQLAVETDLRAEDASFAAAALGSDQVRMRFIGLSGKAEGNRQKLTVHNCRVACDAAEFDAAGELDLAALASAGTVATVLHQPLKLHGKIDLPQVAAMLPSTLRLRGDARFEAGSLEGQWECIRGTSGHEWSAQVAAENVRAHYQGRAVAWQRPLRMDLSARESDAGLSVDRLRCESEFLTADAAGDFDNLAAKVDFNLEQLVAQVSQFVDLAALGARELKLAGTGSANVSWKRQGRSANASLDARVQGFELVLPGIAPFKAAALSAVGVAKGEADWKTLTSASRVDAASLQIETGADRLDVWLLEPVPNAAVGPWPLGMKLAGKLETIASVLSAWMPSGGAPPEGAVQIEADAKVAPSLIEIRKFHMAAAPLKWQLPWLRLDEQRLQLAAAGKFDTASAAIDLSNVQLQTDALAAQADGVHYAWPAGKPPQLTGNLLWRADVAKLLAWLASSSQPLPARIAGQLAGQARIERKGEELTGALQAETSNFTMTLPDGNTLSEPMIRLTAQGKYALPSGMLQIEQASLSSAALAADVTGRMELAKTGVPMSLSGQWQYDWQRLTQMLGPYTGNALQVRGRGASKLAFRRGSDPQQMQGEVDVRWDAAKVYGFYAGPAEASLRAADGMVTLNPMTLDLNGGKLSLAPQLRLSPGPAELVVPKGKLAEQVQITPEMCASGLQFIAPVLAEATEARGTFSIDLEGVRLPIGDWRKLDAAGRFTVHSIEVGASPLVRELALLMGGQIVPGRLRRESVVPFRIVEGRVYHQGLELEFPDVTIRTYGSVGFDESLALMAEMPVPPKLIAQLGNTPAAAALKNQTVKVPIAGTLGRPQLDRRMLDQLLAQFMQNAVRGTIENEVGRQLDRLFGSPPQQYNGATQPYNAPRR